MSKFFDDSNKHHSASAALIGMYDDQKVVFVWVLVLIRGNMVNL